jgi:tetratricopeptide (TPR) repeat protein
MKRLGTLCLLVLLGAAPAAFAQASNLANCKYYTKVTQDFEQGLPYCQKAIEENPEDPEARFYGAWCLAERGQFADAYRSFAWLLERKDAGNKAIEKHAKLAGERVSAYYGEFFNKGLELLNAGDTQGASEQFLHASQIDPRQPAAHLNLGFTLTQLDSLDGALQSFRTAVQQVPADTTAHQFYWDALSRKLAELRSADPPDTAAIAALSGDLRASLEALLRLKAPSADEHLALADLDFAAGNREGGLEHMRTAIELSSDSVVNLVNLGLQFYGNDQHEAVVDAMNLALQYLDDPEDQDVWKKATWVLGLSQYEMEHWADALTQFEKLLALEPENLEYLPRAGMAARKAGQMEKGTAYLVRWEELKEAQVVGDAK